MTVKTVFMYNVSIRCKRCLKLQIVHKGDDTQHIIITTIIISSLIKQRS